MKKIVLLSTDTLHHRYFINYLINRGVDLGSIFFETNKYSASFATGPLFELEEKKFEKDNFFNLAYFRNKFFST